MRLRETRFLLPVLLAGVLISCAPEKADVPSVSLAQAQAEGSAIMAALDAGATVYTSASTTTPAEAAAVENVLTIAKQANAILQGDLSAENAAGAVEAAGQDITAVLAIMPIDPVTKVAIDAGVAVLDTFITEQMATPAAPPVAPKLALALPERTAPPVAIPAPHRLPPGA